MRERTILCQNMIALSQWQHSGPFDDAVGAHLLPAVVDDVGVQVTVENVPAAAASVVDELSFPVVCFRKVESRTATC